MEHENKEKKFQNKQKRKQKQIGKWEINKAKLMPQRAQARERKCCSKDREKKIEPKFSVYYRESDSMKKRQRKVTIWRELKYGIPNLSCTDRHTKQVYTLKN